MRTAILCMLFSGAVQPAPRWTVDSSAETVPLCTLQSLDAKGTLHLRADAKPMVVARVVGLRQAGSVLPPLLMRNFVCLSNGDRIPLDTEAPAVLDGSRLKVWPGKSLPSLNQSSVSLYLPNVVMVFWSIPDGVENAARFLSDIQSDSRKRDVVYLQNGDRLEGAITVLTGKDGCIAMVDGRKIHTPWSKLSGIAWSTERQVRLRTKKAYWRGTLAGGARVNWLDAAFDAKSRRWTGVTQFGVTLDLPEADVLALDRKQADAVELADVIPARYEPKPYLGVTWPIVKNASVTESLLRIGKDSFETGIGVHAGCRIEYKLDGRYQRFIATVGINADARRGRARVAFELDGERTELNDGKDLTRDTAGIPVHLDLNGVRTMTLIVESGSFGDVQAHVDFAHARLIKKE